MDENHPNGRKSSKKAENRPNGWKSSTNYKRMGCATSKIIVEKAIASPNDVNVAVPCLIKVQSTSKIAS